MKATDVQGNAEGLSLESNGLASSAGEYLRQESEDLVVQWIDWVQHRIPTTTIKALPHRALRNHIPPVIEALADFIGSPIHAMRETMLGHLRIHGQIRRDQGYAMHEVLAEFEGLAHMISRRLRQHIEEEHPDASPADLTEIWMRLSTGLRAVSFACVSAFQEFDKRLHQGISSHLETFSRAIVHELRNPLNAIHLISAAIRKLEENAGDTRYDEQLDGIDVAVERAGQFLDNIRLLSIASGAQAGSFLVDLQAAVATARNELTGLALEAGVDLRVADDLPEVHAESIVVHLVLVNLIGNSIKYRNPEREDPFVALSATLIHEEHDSGFLELCVQDNGLGIPEELLPRVTQSGFRAHPEVSQGTGLGLYIVQQILTDRGGSLEIESKPGEGTVVRARFRCLEASVSMNADEAMQMITLVELSVESSLQDYAGERG